MAFSSLLAYQRDTIARLVWKLRCDHQSLAWRVAVPNILNVCEWDTNRVYIKLPFFGVRQHLLDSFTQNLARRNPSSSQNCQRRTA